MAGNFLRHEVIKYFDHRVEGKTEAAEYLDKKGLYIGNHHFDIRKQLAEISKILKFVNIKYFDFLINNYIFGFYYS